MLTTSEVEKRRGNSKKKGTVIARLPVDILRFRKTDIFYIENLGESKRFLGYFD